MRSHFIRVDPTVLSARLMMLTLEERGAYMTLLLASYRGFGRYESGRARLPNALDKGEMRYHFGRHRERVLRSLVERGVISIDEDGSIVCADYEHTAWLRRAATAREMRMVVSERGDACIHCGSKDNLTVDHITPVAVGGDERLENFQPLCRKCNAKKGARIHV